MSSQLIPFLLAAKCVSSNRAKKRLSLYFPSCRTRAIIFFSFMVLMTKQRLNTTFDMRQDLRCTCEGWMMQLMCHSDILESRWGQQGREGLERHNEHVCAQHKQWMCHITSRLSDKHLYETFFPSLTCKVSMKTVASLFPVFIQKPHWLQVCLL